MIEIPLRNRKGEIVARALVDDEDAQIAEGCRWSKHSKGYAVRCVKRDGKLKTILLHRAVMGLKHGERLTVDHINGNRLDCRRSNMRVVTQAQNLQNLRKRPGCTSRYRGVSWHEDTGKWVAYGCVNGQNNYLGVFADEDRAGAVASKWRLEHMPFTVEA